MNAKTSPHIVGQPYSIRLPKTGTLCPWTGQTRTALNDLILPCPANGFKPPVKSFRTNIGTPGEKKGCRLIVYKSLIEHLEKLRLLSEQQTEAAA